VAPFGLIVLLFLSVVRWDAPEMKLLEEVLLRLLVVELWEHFSIVTKVVDECLKCNAISVEEHLVIYHLELVHV